MLYSRALIPTVKEAPADADLTPTQRVLAAKGVGSIRELSPKLNA